jgi:NAD(P)-dependent dehydrogenase (short-subunit alcohol dehydrogenase family)
MGTNIPAKRKVVVITGSTVSSMDMHAALIKKSREFTVRFTDSNTPTLQSGIGKDLAERLHPQGYNIVISGRRTRQGQALATQLDPTGETATYIRCDVTSYESQANLLRETWSKWGRLDVLIANAGTVDGGSVYNLSRLKRTGKEDKDNAAPTSPTEDVPPAPDLSCTDINLKGVMYSTVLAVHYMRHNNNPVPTGAAEAKLSQAQAQHRGKIIITGSTAALFAMPAFPEYCAAKAAAAHWVRTMAPMLKLEGITINSVLPNGYDTAIMPDFEDAFLEEQ